ncbi:DUF2235 domain-containing protein [Bosea sp. NBC_00550]|uniref:DUF2235 domain-containing protein n=1 Tax=Bosea sp. NBC_00550 TaxID=2969621 RepID=UPI00222F02FD|nr:DUF2235 domain-containing protein [Bosea sp. NBC_00550]UZF90539.1 DUF2235 domain-containing protein [Bosea sp. NBC_00550]
MARNICIFSDGTGQAGGANPINWTSVYRLFMATREADPAGQICFYDPGLGSNPDEGEIRGPFRRLKDWLAQATGYGITDNIIDCYAALLCAYRPGDRIFLFGFSRGAYTVRSLGGVLALCGVPGGFAKVMRWDGFTDAIQAAEVRALASSAVKDVYMVKDDAARAEAAAAFRSRHGTQPAPPFFVGVWDTVRALGLPAIGSMPGRHKFHDATLNRQVAHGRHALAIDENREVFAPELWDETQAPPGQIRQVWFAGVHTDIGGGYGLKMGLSDLSLGWMIAEAQAIAHPLTVEPRLIAELRPDALGRQHDERKTSWLPWSEGTREGFVLHEFQPQPARMAASVEPRLQAPAVPILDKMLQYRPRALAEYPPFAAYYRR